MDWDAVNQITEEGYQRWLLLLQQVPAPAGPTSPQPPPPASPWDKPARLGTPAPVTPNKAAAPEPAAAGPGGQAPPMVAPGADRLAHRKDGPSPGLVVNIEDEPDAPASSTSGSAVFRNCVAAFRAAQKASSAPVPAAKADFKAPPPAHLLAKVRPYGPPAQLAQGGSAAASSGTWPGAPSSVPAGDLPPTAAQTFERASSALRARETDLHEAQRKLAISMASAEEAWTEVRHLENANAGWRQRQKEQEAKDDARDFELRELSRLLAACEDQLALAKALLRSLLEC